MGVYPSYVAASCGKSMGSRFYEHLSSLGLNVFKASAQPV